MLREERRWKAVGIDEKK